MEPSFFLARFWGFILVLIPLCYLVRRDSLPKLIAAMSEPPAHLIFVLAGYISIILGTATIVLHNSWYPNLGLLLTFIGWLSLISGILHVVLADRLPQIAALMKNKIHTLRVAIIFAMIAGIVLLLPF